MGEKGLIGATFDLTFSHFVTLKVIRWLFILGLIVAGGLTLAVVSFAFSEGKAQGFASLALSPFFFLGFALFSRLGCEMTIVMFRIAESTARMAEQTREVSEPASRRASG